ncbi:MAG: pyruvate kinase [Acidobacteria bacterium]|nr:pyruvate kinase [Acidobacteriota bacterium]
MQRRTKIVATVGPATQTQPRLTALIEAGVDVFRINSSHGTPRSRQAAAERIRHASDAAGRMVAILQDLAGPKIRIGDVASGARLEAGARFRIATGDFAGSAERVATSYAPLAQLVQPGNRLLLDDGRLAVRVLKTDGSEIVTEVEQGGPLASRKGINAPDVDFPLSAITSADIENLERALLAGVDFIGVSFVQCADDMRRAREAAERIGRPAALVAKIERPRAVDRFDEILAESDAVMVARGDLGIEVPLERVPRVQKSMTRRARAAGVPVIVATQVLETMTHQPRPTRAEVSDAANAVDDGVDAIMLSGETAVGAHPERVVRTLDAIIRDAEASHDDEAVRAAAGFDVHCLDRMLADDTRYGDEVCAAAVMLAETSGAKAVVAVTRSGRTVRDLSAIRPRVPVHAVTGDLTLSRRLGLAWGVAPHTVAPGPGSPGVIREELLREGIVRSGDVVVFVRVNDDLSLPAGNFIELLRC